MTCYCGHPVGADRRCWRCGMTAAERAAMRRLDSLITIGTIVAPYDGYGSIRRELLASYKQLEERQ